jgi:hypothetical protein
VALRAWLGCDPSRPGTPRFCARLVSNLERRRPGQDVASRRARPISLRASCTASETAICAGLRTAQGIYLAPLQWAYPNSAHQSSWESFPVVTRMDFITKPPQIRRGG